MPAGGCHTFVGKCLNYVYHGLFGTGVVAGLGPWRLLPPTEVDFT